MAPGSPRGEGGRQRLTAWPPLVGDFVLGNPDSPVAVCTLASRSLLPHLAGRPEIAIAGRVYTENVGIERMVQNLVSNPRLRVLIVCGRESPHRTGQTILSLHRQGLDSERRVAGLAGPEPSLPNLEPAQLRRFQERIQVIDLIGELSVERIVARARLASEAIGEAGRVSATAAGGPAPARDVKRIRATADAAADWRYDPTGFFLIFVERDSGALRVEHYSQDRTLLRIVEGRTAREVCDTLVRLGLVTEMGHAAYLGRELARAEAAARLELRYEQDSPLDPNRRA
ncbi:MAG TPA: DUF4346 domain-containing protein [Chloroflexota bacterium]|nr:DUF4346 domain-containing protein [Chloroflexota bacterium]